MIPHKASLRICVCLALLVIYFEWKHLGLTVGSNSARSVPTYSLHSSKSLLSQWSNISKGASSMKTLPDSFNGDDTVPNLCPQVPPNLGKWTHSRGKINLSLSHVGTDNDV